MSIRLTAERGEDTNDIENPHVAASATEGQDVILKAIYRVSGEISNRPKKNAGKAVRTKWLEKWYETDLIISMNLKRIIACVSLMDAQLEDNTLIVSWKWDTTGVPSGRYTAKAVISAKHFSTTKVDLEDPSALAEARNTN